MLRLTQLAALVILVFAGASCRSPIDRIAESHIEGNVPKGNLFDEYLKRDLEQYFCKEREKCAVEYELLRKGPTQTGIAYPKFYLWVKTVEGQIILSEGAIRVAAIDQKGFEITDFLSREEILNSPFKVGSVFPAALVDKIMSKARPQ